MSWMRWATGRLCSGTRSEIFDVGLACSGAIIRRWILTLPLRTKLRVGGSSEGFLGPPMFWYMRTAYVPAPMSLDVVTAIEPLSSISQSP
jgi:hypothetical protein